MPPIDTTQARALEPDERRLVEWLVMHGHQSGRSCLGQVPHLRVVEEKRGNDILTISFAHPEFSEYVGPMVMLAEFCEHRADGAVTTVVLFGRGGHLVELQIWSAESAERAPQLPKPEALREIT